MLIENNLKVFFIMGGPGSNKVALGRLVAEKYDLIFLSTGDLLRADVARRGSEGGKRLQQIMARGEFVPLTDVMNLLKEAIREKAASSPGFIIEGFPRDAEQAAKFMDEVAPCHAVIFLEIPDVLMVHRLLMYNQCADNQAVVRTRLRLYKGRTEPLINYFAKCGLVIKISSLGTEDEIFKRLLKGLLNFTMSRTTWHKSLSDASNKSGKLPANLESKSKGVAAPQWRWSSLPSRNSWSHSKKQPEVWRRCDMTYRDGNTLVSKGQSMSLCNSHTQKVELLPKDEPHRQRTSRVRASKQTSQIEPLHRQKQHFQTSQAQLPAKNEQHAEISKVQPSYRHETYSGTNRVKTPYIHETYSGTNRVKTTYRHETYSGTNRVKTPYRHETYSGTNRVKTPYRHETHSGTSRVKTALQTRNTSTNNELGRTVWQTRVTCMEKASGRNGIQATDGITDCGGTLIECVYM